MLPFLDQTGTDFTLVLEGIETLNAWSRNEVTGYEIRQAGFKIHSIARSYTDDAAKLACRTIGHAIAIGHMYDHAMVASDYAVKTIGLFYNHNMAKITEERKWQIEEINQII